jgi:hypothetical protein
MPKAARRLAAGVGAFRVAAGGRDGAVAGLGSALSGCPGQALRHEAEGLARNNPVA